MEATVSAVHDAQWDKTLASTVVLSSLNVAVAELLAGNASAVPESLILIVLGAVFQALVFSRVFFLRRRDQRLLSRPRLALIFGNSYLERIRATRLPSRFGATAMERGLMLAGLLVGVLAFFRWNPFESGVLWPLAVGLALASARRATDFSRPLIGSVVGLLWEGTRALGGSSLAALLLYILVAGEIFFFAWQQERLDFPARIATRPPPRPDRSASADWVVPTAQFVLIAFLVFAIFPGTEARKGKVTAPAKPRVAMSGSRAARGGSGRARLPGPRSTGPGGPEQGTRDRAPAPPPPVTPPSEPLAVGSAPPLERARPETPGAGEGFDEGKRGFTLPLVGSDLLEVLGCLVALTLGLERFLKIRKARARRRKAPPPLPKASPAHARNAYAHFDEQLAGLLHAARDAGDAAAVIAVYNSFLDFVAGCGAGKPGHFTADEFAGWLEHRYATREIRGATQVFCQALYGKLSPPRPVFDAFARDIEATARAVVTSGHG